MKAVMVAKKQAGFTLVELLVSLAITGLLLATISFGRGNTRSQIKFQTGVDEFVNILTTARAEAYRVPGRGVDSTNGPDDPYAGYLIGQVVEITANQADVWTRGLVYNEPYLASSRCGVAIGTYTRNCDRTSKYLNWNVRPVNIPYAGPTHGYILVIAFGIDAEGNPAVYDLTAAAGTVANIPLDNFPALKPSDPPITIELSDYTGLAGHRANVMIDSRGNITKEIY